jgi:hypothetical protein
MQQRPCTSKIERSVDVQHARREHSLRGSTPYKKKTKASVESDSLSPVQRIAETTNDDEKVEYDRSQEHVTSEWAEEEAGNR